MPKYEGKVGLRIQAESYSPEPLDIKWGEIKRLLYRMYGPRIYVSEIEWEELSGDFDSGGETPDPGSGGFPI